MAPLSMNSGQLRMTGAIVGWRNGPHGPGVPDDDAVQRTHKQLVTIRFIERYQV